MLQRYDEMLEASSVETGVGSMMVGDNRDGRFDDPEEGEEEELPATTQ